MFWIFITDTAYAITALDGELKQVQGQYFWHDVMPSLKRREPPSRPGEIGILSPRESKLKCPYMPAHVSMVVRFYKLLRCAPHLCASRTKLSFSTYHLAPITYHLARVFPGSLTSAWMEYYELF